MAVEEAMTINERRTYLKRMLPRYRAANRAERGRLLADMEAMTGMHRKSLIRLLAAPSLARPPRHTVRTRIYGHEIAAIISVVWESLDYLCAERLTPVLVETATHLATFGELTLTPTLCDQLTDISRATVGRMLKGMRRPTPRLPRRGPEQANRLRKAVPMGRLPWQTTTPGWFEVDLVHHSGESTAGDYLHTLQLVDIATGWSERVAILGRGQQAMEEGFRQVVARLPFPIQHLHSDNGSEFFNHHLVRFWGEEITGLTLSRSRPYQKNDNRFVEQKNDTLVRAYVGYDRLDTREQRDALNLLYEQLWVYYNLFQPVLHLIAKERQADRVIRKWDEAQTPYQRVVAAGGVDAATRTRLDALHAATNPRQLRREIYAGLARLWEREIPAMLVAD
ncbi:MAG: DDE-type integrase/transposase/recombinase [Gemmatimonadaceae bacterium]